MKLSDPNWRERVSRLKLDSLDGWIAESQSLYSAPSPGMVWSPKVETSRTAMVVIFLSLFLRPWESDQIVYHISQRAYAYRYNGLWQSVQEQLETADTPERFLSNYLKTHSENELYGNFFPVCNRFLRYYAKAFKGPSKGNRPKRKIRRRGYNDKGTLRPFHQRGRNLPDPSPPPEDRRFLVIHPILRQDLTLESVAETLVSDRKEVYFHDS